MLSRWEERVLRELAACRTAALGGHADQCDHCGQTRVAYNSCRNRHCPKCQGAARARWLEARRGELLPVEYFHVVFTLPHLLTPLVAAQPRAMYELLFAATAATLQELAADPTHLGAQLGVLAVLHTWGQNLERHPHLHCVIPGGGLSLDGQRWISCRPGFFLPVRVLSRLFRGKFLAALRAAFDAGRFSNGHAPAIPEREDFQRLLAAAYRTEWVVYAKPPFGGPEQVLKYLARYTHRVAISNDRLISLTDGRVSFRWKNYAQGSQQQTMTLSAVEFLRRFLTHVLPRGFVRIRYYGWLANSRRQANLARCRELLGAQPPVVEPSAPEPTPAETEAASAFDPAQCSHCGLGHWQRVWEAPRPCRAALFALPLLRNTS